MKVANERRTEQFIFIVYCVVATYVLFLLARYVQVAYMLRKTQRVEVQPTIEIIDPSSVPTEVKAYFTQIVTQLEDEGFHVTASIGRPNAVTNARDYRVFLSHCAAGDRAVVAAIAINRDDEWRIARKYFGLSTRFESGEVFDTLNTPYFYTFPLGLKHTRTQLFTIHDPRELYRIHRWLLKCHAINSAKTVYKKDDEIITRFVEITTGTQARQAQLGFYFKDKSGEFYEPTWKAAFLQALRMKLPISLCVGIANAHVEQKLLRAYRKANYQ